MIKMATMQSTVLYAIATRRKYDRIGVGSGDFGIVSLKSVINTAKDKNMVTVEEIRSPLSAGKRNTNGFRKQSRKIGAKIVNAKYSGRR